MNNGIDLGNAVTALIKGIDGIYHDRIERAEKKCRTYECSLFDANEEVKRLKSENDRLKELLRVHSIDEGKMVI